MLYRAATGMPYYREHWVARRRKGDRASWEYLENWPILGKDSVRANASAFVADDCKMTAFEARVAGVNIDFAFGFYGLILDLGAIGALTGVILYRP